MKSPDHYHREAALARRDAIGLGLFAWACLLALLLIGDGCRGGAFWWVPLALLVFLMTAAAGAVNEWAEARRLRRLAWMEETFQPLEHL